MTKVVDEPALVLHTRPYRDSSMIVDLLTANYGRVGAVRLGGRGGKAGNALQVFSFCSATWFGRGQLMTLTTTENIKPHWLTGAAAAGAYYVVELIVRLVREREPVPIIFAAACAAIERLACGEPPSQPLRIFEHRLLDALGYGVDFTADARSRLSIQPNAWYRFMPSQGFSAAPTDLAAESEDPLYLGEHLLAISNDLYSSPQVRRAAMLIFRTALAEHLGPEPLQSRELLPPVFERDS